MDSGFLVVPTVILLTIGAVPFSRLWRAWPLRLAVFGVTLFAELVIAFQVLGVIAAVSRAPVVRAAPLVVASAAVAACIWLLSKRLAGWLPRGEEGCGPARSESGGGRASGRVPEVLVGLFAAFVFANAANLGLSAPPRGWDVLSYHMPKALAWLQHGNLGNYGTIATFYPGNGELAVLLSMFTGTDRLAPLVQLPFGLLGAIGVYGIARELGGRRLSSAAATLVFLGAPMVLFQSALAKDDLMVAGLVLAGVLLLMRSTRARGGRRFSLLELCVSGIAFGLAVGVKYSVLPLIVLAVPAVYVTRFRAVRSWRDLETSRATRSAAVRTGLFVLLALVPSLFWFVQNWIVAGNPFAPLSLGTISGAFGRHDPVYVSNNLLWFVYPWIDRAIKGSYSASAGFGAAFAALALPAFGLCVWRIFRGGARKRLRLARLTLVGFAAGGAVMWWLGGHHLPRFLLPAVGLACAPVALLLDEVASRARATVGVLLGLALLFSTAESLRVIYAENDLLSSHLGYVGKQEHYHMPDWVYEVAPGTRILILDIPGVDIFNTYRYPVAGNLPGNEVFMMGDWGFEPDLVQVGPVLGHQQLLRADIEYIFVRTLAVAPGPTIFDRHPDLYELELDLIERPYKWYKKGYISLPGEDRDVRAPALTKVYRVLRNRQRP
ncbi:MAG: phospholipid carrier-dependent glycosyltransferase [Candidatus Eisenbacteria bacterium]|nr:phospholipid carrier-dependent glycosyltransferase [Candidatus Eisenbacteria bacterium]